MSGKRCFGKFWMKLWHLFLFPWQFCVSWDKVCSHCSDFADNFQLTNSSNLMYFASNFTYLSYHMSPAPKCVFAQQPLYWGVPFKFVMSEVIWPGNIFKMCHSSIQDNGFGKIFYAKILYGFPGRLCRFDWLWFSIFFQRFRFHFFQLFIEKNKNNNKSHKHPLNKRK